MRPALRLKGRLFFACLLASLPLLVEQIPATVGACAGTYRLARSPPRRAQIDTAAWPMLCRVVFSWFQPVSFSDFVSASGPLLARNSPLSPANSGNSRLQGAPPIRYLSATYLPHLFPIASAATQYTSLPSLPAGSRPHSSFAACPPAVSRVRPPALRAAAFGA